MVSIKKKPNILGWEEEVNEAMVNWEGMQTVLRARGFNDLWCTWIKNILQSAKSAVLVNGCPGPWIACKCGLRQGDPCHLGLV
jgi:hypothetical protein